MKQLLFSLLVCLSLGVGYAQDFSVDHYAVAITVHEEGYFDVVENYDLTFDIPKHGIYRDIQTTYDLVTENDEQETRTIKISNVEVPGHSFKTSSLMRQKLDGTYQIKIGDAHNTIMGPQHYTIKYRVHNAFLHETDGVKFYWNLKPSDWWATFNTIAFTIHLPSSIGLNRDNVFVYSGVSGTSEISQDIDLTFSDGKVEGKSRPHFESNSGENVTVLINMPLNSVAELKPFWPFWTDYGWVFVILALVIGFYMTWVRFGKDDAVISITSYFAPDGMDPAMAGYLINDSDDVSDMISLIPYWGSKGMLRVEEIPKNGWFSSSDTKLIALKPLPSDAPSYEQIIFEGLFGSAIHPGNTQVLVSSLKNVFYTDMRSARRTLKEEAQPYYEADSKRVRNITYGVLFLLMLVMVPIVFLTWDGIAVFAIIVTTLFLLIMNKHMIKKNPKGNAVISELKGFRQFIKVAEINKLKMLMAEDPSYFEITMGYALAFGLFDKWASKFAALNMPPPDWYQSASHTSFTMRNFSNSFANTMSSVQSTMVSSPSSSGSSSSSGGGTSGGGFGGGGGGSW